MQISEKLNLLLLEEYLPQYFVPPVLEHLQLLINSL
jgi:hypothetical protein